jgi:thioredoxin
VLVDFWAPWCAPCRRLAPTVDQLAEEYNGRITVAKMNIDENPMTPNRFMVRGIPTLLLFKNGDLKETIVGLAGKDDLVRVIDKHMSN